MDAITALASWPKSIDEIAHAVADPESPPTAAQIREVARAIGDGDVRIIVNGDRTNLRLTQYVILGCLRLATMVQEEVTGVLSFLRVLCRMGSMHSWQRWARWPPLFY